MESIWVIGDVHGCRDSWMPCWRVPRSPTIRAAGSGSWATWSTAGRRRPRHCGGSGRWASAPPSCSAITTCGRWRSPPAACGRAAAIRWTSCCARATPRRCWTGCAGSRCCTPKPATCWCTPASIRAGILPRRWRAREVEALLRHPRWRQHLPRIRGPSPLSWRDTMSGAARLRFIVRAFTQMRLCRPDAHWRRTPRPRRDAGHPACCPGSTSRAGRRGRLQSFWPLGNAGIAGAVGRGVPGYRVRIRRRIDSPAPG